MLKSVESLERAAQGSFSTLYQALSEESDACKSHRLNYNEVLRRIKCIAETKNKKLDGESYF